MIKKNRFLQLRVDSNLLKEVNFCVALINVGNPSERISLSEFIREAIKIKVENTKSSSDFLKNLEDKL